MNHNHSARWQTALFVILALVLLPQIGSAQQQRVSERMRAMWPEFANWAPVVGETAIDFTLETLEGETFTLSEQYRDKPVVIEFGSFT